MNTIDLQLLIKKFGPPGYENSKGQLTKLNEPFWAAYYAASREKIIFEPTEGRLYDYRPEAGIFTPQSDDLTRTQLAEHLFNAAHSFTGYSPLEQLRSAQHVKGVIAHLRGQIEKYNFFNQKDYYAHLGNCTLRFTLDGSDFKKEPFSPSHRTRNRSPIIYDPKAQCPIFKEKLLSHLPEDDRLFLQKYSGQCLLGRNLIQRLAILDGIGSASKSAFVLTIAGIIGGDNIYELRTNLLGERFEIGRMIGRTLLIGPDVKGNFLTAKGAHKIKALVGGDPHEAEIKGSNHRFTIYGIFNMFLTSNSRLCVLMEGDYSAWERRLVIIRYDTRFIGQRIVEVQKYLLEKEASGILNWCIEGLQMLIADYHRTGDIILSQTQKERVTNLLAESDSLRLFVANEIVKDETRNSSGHLVHSLTVEEIVKEYSEDCVTKDWSPLAPSAVERRLPELMMRQFQIGKSNDIPRNGKPKRGFWMVKF
jgi:hypothetical protein